MEFEGINDVKKFKLNVVKHSTKQKILKKTDIYLVDTFGETKNFYNLSNIAFLGGSIVNHGGQNPLEAARMGNYIINGPNVYNFTEIYDYLKINKISYKTSNILKMRDIVLSKINKKPPTDLANILVDAIKNSDEQIQDISIIKPGFINIKFKSIFWTHFVEEIIKDSKTFGINTKEKKKNYLGLYRFKTLKNLTKKNVSALGGLTKNNKNQMKLVNCNSFAGITYFKKKAPTS